MSTTINISMDVPNEADHEALHTEEKRMDGDQGPFTRAEFFEEYGDYTEWEAAETEEARSSREWLREVDDDGWLCSSWNCHRPRDVYQDDDDADNWSCWSDQEADHEADQASAMSPSVTFGCLAWPPRRRLFKKGDKLEYLEPTRNAWVKVTVVDVVGMVGDFDVFNEDRFFYTVEAANGHQAVAVESKLRMSVINEVDYMLRMAGVSEHGRNIQLEEFDLKQLEEGVTMKDCLEMG
jgi:hypothetical protein